jgi:hypothetical protein
LCIFVFAIAQSKSIVAAPKPIDGPKAAAVVADKVAAVAAAAAAAAPQPVAQQAFFGTCSQGANWVRYNNYCYLFHEEDAYWYVAEQDCKRYGGHLVSIVNSAENSLVAKMTYCESAFIGRFAINVDKLSDPTNYRWTDGSSSPSGYHNHDFTSITSIHEPLISVSDEKWRNRVYHSRDKYVCKARYQGSGGGNNVTCDEGWVLVGNDCYRMPKDTASFIEATFYCSGRSANLASIYSVQELRALSLLDLDTPGCPVQTWVGLIKINPCRIDFSTGNKICYKWADRLVEYHNDFPAWHPGYPDTGDRVNCVLLQDRAMKTVECYERHRFICKKPARRA